MVSWTVGVTEEGVHQGWALGPFLFAKVIDRLTDKVGQESLWTMMFEDDTVIWSESRERGKKLFPTILQ